VLNAQTPQMWGELRKIGAELPGDVRVVVVRGEGRAFSAGIDLTVATGGEFASLAVHGHAIGAGFQLALSCDLRVVADDAKFCMAEVSLGLVPDLGGIQPLRALVGPARAFELCVTGRRIDAAEADRMGMVNLVVPRADLDGAVADLTAAVLAGARDAVVEIKALVAGAGSRDLAAQLRAEREAQLRRLRDLSGAGE